MSKPRIGIARKGGTLSKTQETSHARYRARVEECGGYPVDLLVSANASFKSVQHEGIQGLLFTGGGDLDPLLYGEQNRASNHIDNGRDRFEIELMRGALNADMPILAICRGFQILNVACGGTLLLDILPPYRQNAAEAGISAQHAVELTEGSRLHSLLAKSPIAVNSRHHQAVTRRTLGCPLVATAFSSGEDIVERIEKPGKAWVVGVQWHPERIEDSFQVLFRDFIRAAAAK
jgi:gamma-glutamyl-gamma-aminobutyrate hydrolase PuuD